MKKGILILLAVVAVFGMTGCGEKKLTCKIDNSQLGLEANSTVEIKFKKDTVDSMKVSMDIVVPDEYQDEKKDLMDMFKESYENIKVTETNSGIRIESDGNSSDFVVSGVTGSYGDVKKDFEDLGYTCK